MRQAAARANLHLDNRDTWRCQMATTVQQAPGLWRTDLQEHDLSVPGRHVIQNRVDVSPEAPYVRHKHPGEEIIYVLEGTLQYDIDVFLSIMGRPPGSLTVPSETVFGFRNVVL